MNITDEAIIVVCLFRSYVVFTIAASHRANNNKLAAVTQYDNTNIVYGNHFGSFVYGVLQPYVTHSKWGEPSVEYM